jgi:short-subunit dehydrogenase
MEQKKIIIVGATSGMGRRMAELYLEKGHVVGITGRRLELLQELQQRFPGKVEYACFDVRGKENMVHIESLVKKINGLDILVISAGNGDTSEDLNWEIDQWTVETNVNGFVEIANWTFNFFVKQGHGSLATISSIAAIRGSSWAPAYNASKAFQSTYFEGLSVKAKRMKKNVSVTCIEPGFVKTKMAKSNKLFWVVPVDKAARQIITAIDKRKRKVYVSKRWWIIAKLLKWLPWWVYKRIA